MKIVYWDIENIKFLQASYFKPGFTADLIRVCHAKPFDHIDDRICIPYSKLHIESLAGRGPDLADIQILSYLNHDVMRLGREVDIYLITEDKLFSYRFIVLCRNLGVKHERIHTLLSDNDIRRRRKKGRTLFEEDDLEKIPLFLVNEHQTPEKLK